MTCVRRLAGAQSSAPSTPAASSRPDPRPGRRSARLSLLLPALALLVVGALGLAIFTAAPAQAQTSWSGELTVNSISGGFGCGSANECNSSLSNGNSLTVGSTSYSIIAILLTTNGSSLTLGFTPAMGTDLQALKFCVGSNALGISSGTLGSGNQSVAWTNPGVGTWSAGDKVRLSLGSACHPGPVTGLTVTPYSTGALGFAWSAPTVTGGSAITGYDVHYTSSTTVDDDAATRRGSDDDAGWVDDGPHGHAFAARTLRASTTARTYSGTTAAHEERGRGRPERLGAHGTGVPAGNTNANLAQPDGERQRQRRWHVHRDCPLPGLRRRHHQLRRGGGQHRHPRKDHPHAGCSTGAGRKPSERGPAGRDPDPGQSRHSPAPPSLSRWGANAFTARGDRRGRRHRRQGPTPSPSRARRRTPNPRITP